MDAFEERIKKLEPTNRKEFERIRSIVHGKLEKVDEVVSYQMPAFKYKGKPILYVGSFKDHMSIFPTTGPIKKLSKELAGYQINKGTIRFTTAKPLPKALIENIIDIRRSEIDQGSK